MRVETIPLILGILIALIGLAILADAWLPEEMSFRSERRRRIRVERSISGEASLGIAQASVVHTDDELAERVGFVHSRIGSDAIVEEFIDGRELYVAAFGNERITVLPTWELLFENLAAAL